VRAALAVVALAVAACGCQAPPDGALATPGPATELAIAPDNLATLWAVTATGTFRSPDGGHSWYRVARLRADSVAFVPSGSLVATGGGRLIAASSSGSGGLHGGLSTPARFVWVSSPWYLSGRVYALDASGRLWHSHDGGRRWRRSPGRGLPAHARDLVAVESHHGRPDVLYAVAGGGVYASYDSGARFRRVARVDATAIASTPARPGLLLVAGPGGLWNSTDGGRTLTLVRGVRGVRAIACDPWNWRVAFAATSAGQLLRSFDGGRTWSLQKPAQGT
jgi:photosystem II stability/assembly factor-like uncharacterized protein